MRAARGIDERRSWRAHGSQWSRRKQLTTQYAVGQRARHGSVAHIGAISPRFVASTIAPMSLVKLTQVHDTVSVYFACQKCQYYCSANVRTHGQGSSNLVEGDDVGVERARLSAKTMAEQTLLFVPCPACGHQQSGGKALRRRQRVIAALGPVALLELFALIIYLFERPPLHSVAILAITCAVIGALGGAWGYYVSPRPWANARERVVFEPQR